MKYDSYSAVCEKLKMAMFTINVIFIKTVLREIWFEMWNGFNWHRKIRFCEDSNIYITCSFIIKQFKLNVLNVNNIINIHQSDKCANECPEFDTKHWHKPVRVQISLQPPQAGKISCSHDIQPCMWHSYSGTAIQRKMPIWPPLSINIYVHYEIFFQLIPVQR